jgi:hypothetical protein
VSEDLRNGILVNLLPAILAGMLGGFGAYVAVKTDVAVLLSNQAALIEQGKMEVVIVNRHELDINLLKYQVDKVTEEVERINGGLVKR